ncbi:stage II sporulation protein P [Bacillus salitolerans]|uniref:Stage II sporulation protein P n=1 Tax=Bacillus salitolerans TaxID=1437434 RepID=A0ABW4LMV5_9BACI
MRNNSLKNSRVRTPIFFIIPIIYILMMFIIASSIVMVKEDSFTFHPVKQNVQKAPIEFLVEIISLQNTYFKQDLLEDMSPISFSKVAFETTLQIQLGDIRTLIGNELPGYAFFDTKILVPGLGTNYTNIPYESSPPLEDLLQERELSKIELEKLETIRESETITPPVSTSIKKRVLIYHTHSYESYLPLIGLTGDPDENKAVDAKTNITLVGEMLGKQLEQKGIGVTVDQTNIGQELNRRNWGVTRAYEVSRTIVESAMENNDNIEYLIDIHRDSARRKTTTITINNMPYARVYFIVGQASENYEKSFLFANKIHEELELQYPGISRGVFEKGLTEGNGHYNQDLSDNSILIEVGGVDNDMVEIKNTVDALANVISNYLLNEEKENNNG